MRYVHTRKISGSARRGLLAPQEIFDEFLQVGHGKFRNSLLSDIKILDAVRLKKKASAASNAEILEDFDNYRHIRR